MVERNEFFRPGGTLPPGSESYVTRHADDEIVAALLSGDFVFILDSRQKGKSSLIVRSLEKLHQRGITTIRIDLQRLGTNLQPDQWYAGLLHSIGQELGCTKELFQYWKERTRFGPSFRFFGVIEEAILPLIEGPVVIFIDEVDFVQALPFSTDEFFAAIRECYNRRTEKTEFRRLSFCLAGVAAPSQLIHNEDVTPFNVGRRIELSDFTREETRLYAEEISRQGRNGEILLDRIHDWVSGHPYLTQLLASQTSEDVEIALPRDVDRLVRRTLLSAEARQREPNIADTERRLLEATFPGESKEESRSRLLEVYRLLLQGNLVSANHEEPLISTILLSGIAVEEAGTLRIRNQLYRTIFDERWRRNNLPDTEAQRQHAASVRTGWRVGLVALCVLSMILVVLARLLSLTHDRDQALLESLRLTRENVKIAYETSMALASERIDEGSFLKSLELVESQRSSPERGWEWGFLDASLREQSILQPAIHPDHPTDFVALAWREEGSLIQTREADILQDGSKIASLPSKVDIYHLSHWLRRTRGQGHLAHRLRVGLTYFSESEAKAVDVSPDLNTVASTTQGKTGFDLIDRGSGRRTHVDMKSEPAGIYFSPKGRLVSATGKGGKATYDIQGRRWIKNFGPLSPDEKYIANIDHPPLVSIVRMRNQTVAARLIGHSAAVFDVQWFRDGKRLVTASYDGTIRLWSFPSGKLLRVLVGNRAGLITSSLSADERTILGTAQDGEVMEWRLDIPPPVQTMNFHKDQVLCVPISQDGSRCLTISIDGTAVLIDTKTGKAIAAYGRSTPLLPFLTSFSPDSTMVALIDTKREILLISAATGSIVRRLSIPGKHPVAVAFSPGKSLAVALREGQIVTLSSPQAEPLIRPSPGFSCKRICYSPDGSQVAVASKSGYVALLDPRTMAVSRLMKKVNDDISEIEFSPDGRWLSSATHDRHAYLFALDGSDRTTTLEGHSSRVWEARFSPDSTKVLTTSFDGTARVWNVKDGAAESVLQHDSWVSTAEWSPDGRRIVTSCADKFVRIFDPENGFEIVRLSGHRDLVLDAKFLPDGKTLVTGSADRTVRFWRSKRSTPLPTGSGIGSPGMPAPGNRAFPAPSG